HAMRLAELSEPARAYRTRCELRMEIAHEGLGKLNVVAEDLLQCKIHTPRCHVLQRWKAEAFLVDLCRVRRDRARRHPADILVVHGGHAEGEDALLREHRDEERNVRQVRTATIGIVEDVHVARFHRGDGVLVDDRCKRRDHRGEMDRYGGRPGGGLPLPRKKPPPTVPSFLYPPRGTTTETGGPAARV